MAFRQFPNTNTILQGGLAQKAKQNAAPSTVNNGSAASAKILAGDWARGPESANPQLTSPPPWFTGERAFSSLRGNNPGQFDEWKDRFDNQTFAGYEFRPPPPENNNSAPAEPASKETA